MFSHVYSSVLVPVHAGCRAVAVVRWEDGALGSPQTIIHSSHGVGELLVGEGAAHTLAKWVEDGARASGYLQLVSVSRIALREEP